MRKMYFILIFLLILTGCDRSSSHKIPSQLTGEYIYRRHSDRMISENLISDEKVKKDPYPWDQINLNAFPKITKDFFRCKGSLLNPVRMVQKGKELIRYYDCGGSQKHSLILRDGKEFIYPILIELLNHIQNETGKRVVITCGHCCPDHNNYLDPSPSNQATKHLIGAEVDFYVQGLEFCPEDVVKIILNYYQKTEKYIGNKRFQEFKRYTKDDAKVSVQPWYNEEIFVKMVQKNEGRDLDNRHMYPYICIQVRYDWDLKEKVTYSWDKAFKNFHRW